MIAFLFGFSPSNSEQKKYIQKTIHFGLLRSQTLAWMRVWEKGFALSSKTCLTLTYSFEDSATHFTQIDFIVKP